MINSFDRKCISIRSFCLKDLESISMDMYGAVSDTVLNAWVLCDVNHITS